MCIPVMSADGVCCMAREEEEEKNMQKVSTRK